jgi:hypothetical protein
MAQDHNGLKGLATSRECQPSDPLIIHGGTVPTFMPGVQDAPWLDHHQLGFGFGGGSVLYAARDYVEFTWRHIDRAIWEVDTQGAFEYQERLVGFGVGVLDEFAFDAYYFELVVVHFGDDAWAPLLVD